MTTVIVYLIVIYGVRYAQIVPYIHVAAGLNYTGVWFSMKRGCVGGDSCTQNGGTTW